jgi:hypothetical protein
MNEPVTADLPARWLADLTRHRISDTWPLIFSGASGDCHLLAELASSLSMKARVPIGSKSSSIFAISRAIHSERREPIPQQDCTPSR